jgi:N-acetylglutamate synthase-like GNAT family acetyltransferase
MKKEGEYVVKGIATDPAYRKNGLGARLLDRALTHLQTIGARRVYLVARAPGFFRTQGFSTVARAEAPKIDKCDGCDQYGVKCHPEIMLKYL